jgi:hypothetical protein
MRSIMLEVLCPALFGADVNYDEVKKACGLEKGQP